MACQTEGKLSELAILKQIPQSSRDLVKDHEKVIVIDENYCHADLAFSFGDQPAKWIEMVDEKLKTATLPAVTKINVIDRKDRTWDMVVAQLQNLPMLQSFPEEDVHKENEKSFSMQQEHEESLSTPQENEKSSSTQEEDISKIESDDEITAREVIDWFQKDLISDQDVLKATPIDIEQLAGLVIRVWSDLKISHKTQVTTRNIVDIGVLRFPDLNDPYIKLYRIEVKLFVEKNTSNLAHKIDKGLICGDYHCRKYKPNADFIELVSSEAKKMAVAAANELFMDF